MTNDKVKVLIFVCILDIIDHINKENDLVNFSNVLENYQVVLFEEEDVLEKVKENDWENRRKDDEEIVSLKVKILSDF